MQKSNVHVVIKTSIPKHLERKFKTVNILKSLQMNLQVYCFILRQKLEADKSLCTYLL